MELLVKGELVIKIMSIIHAKYIYYVNNYLHHLSYIFDEFKSLLLTWFVSSRTNCILKFIS